MEKFKKCEYFFFMDSLLADGRIITNLFSSKQLKLVKIIHANKIKQLKKLFWIH